MIEADVVIERLIYEQYKFLESHFKLAFDAVCMKRDRSIGLEHFCILFVGLFKKKYSILEITKIFKSIADLSDRETDTQYLSFKALAEYLLHERKIKGDIIEKWLSDVDQHQVRNMNQLELEWNLRKNLIQLRYVQLYIYAIYHQELIESIDLYFKNKRSGDEEEAKLIWARYRILEEDSRERYFRRFVEVQYLPSVFIEISKYH